MKNAALTDNCPALNVKHKPGRCSVKHEPPCSILAVAFFFFSLLTLWVKCRCIHYPVITLLLVLWYIIHYMHSPHGVCDRKGKMNERP